MIVIKKGIICKLQGGLYEVNVAGVVYLCRARGLFRLEEIKPLVGDYVEIEPDQFEACKGYIVEVLPRKSVLIRPPVANVDQAIITIALKKPNPNFLLFDKMLISCEMAGVQPIIVINKNDLDEGDDYATLCQVYRATGYTIVATSAKSSLHLAQLSALLTDKVSVFSGPSGVGKSTLLNQLVPGADLKTGEISKKIKRGRHTTRHTELIALPDGGFVLDTPGFTSLNIAGTTIYDLAHFMPEIARFGTDCKFDDCMHISEPGCRVRQAVKEGDIHESRYHSYASLHKQLELQRR